MQLKTLSKELKKKLPATQIIIAVTALILFGNGNCFSQSNEKGQAMKANSRNKQIKNAVPHYLDKNDPIVIAIKKRTVADLQQFAKMLDPESQENKLVGEKIKNWTEEKKNQLQDIGAKSLSDYTDQIQFSLSTFMLVLDGFGQMDQKEFVEDYDIRVRVLGSDQYIAEFWLDWLIANSEEHALVRAHELATSEYAKKHPDSGVGDVKKIKDTFANVRKLIKAGKQERYTKEMALLYSKEKDGSVIFRDPFQTANDFINK